MQRYKIGISACLLGRNCRYDGENCLNKTIAEIIKDQIIVPVCPETAGGLGTPRDPSEIRNGLVISINGKDVTNSYQSGALKELDRISDCDFLILKKKSPACGRDQIYDGSFSGKLIDGNGVFAQLALNKNIPIFTEDEDEKICEFLSSKAKG